MSTLKNEYILDAEYYSRKRFRVEIKSDSKESADAIIQNAIDNDMSVYELQHVLGYNIIKSEDYIDYPEVLSGDDIWYSGDEVIRKTGTYK